LSTVKPSGEQAGEGGYGLTRDDFSRLDATLADNIETAVQVRTISKNFGRGQRQLEGRLVGCTPEFAEIMRLEIEPGGRFLTPSDGKEERNYCVLGPNAKAQLVPYGNPVGATVRVGDEFYTVVGVVKPRRSATNSKAEVKADDLSNDIY